MDVIHQEVLRELADAIVGLLSTFEQSWWLGELPEE